MQQLCARHIAAGTLGAVLLALVGVVLAGKLNPESVIVATLFVLAIPVAFEVGR